MDRSSEAGVEHAKHRKLALSPADRQRKGFFRLFYGRPTLVEYLLCLYSSLALSILCLSYRVV